MALVISICGISGKAMGKAIHPLSLRLGYVKNWKSRWFSIKQMKNFLEQDVLLRKHLIAKLKSAGVESVEIERFPGSISIIIKVARPGMLIGRGGTGVETLKNEVEKFLRKLKSNDQIRIQIEEVKNADISAPVVAQSIAHSIEKRMPYRSVFKKTMEKVMAHKGVLGIKLAIAGRIGGAEIARRERMSRGKLPLNTLRADIDYGETRAETTYGTLGIKVWIYKGEIL